MKTEQRLRIFSERLRAIRVANGMTQEDLASKLCVTRVSVHYWESRKRLPPFGTVIEISEIFDVSIDFLTGGSDLWHQT